MRILVTGARNYTDREELEAMLGHWYHELAITQPDRYLREGLTVVTGACPQGADAMAEDWANAPEQFSVELDTHPADWSYGQTAGFARNQEMVDAGADVVLAFQAPCVKPTCPQQGKHGSHGTTDLMTRARAAGLVMAAYGKTSW